VYCWHFVKGTGYRTPTAPSRDSPKPQPTPKARIKFPYLGRCTKLPGLQGSAPVPTCPLAFTEPVLYVTVCFLSAIPRSQLTTQTGPLKSAGCTYPVHGSSGTPREAIIILDKPPNCWKYPNNFVRTVSLIKEDFIRNCNCGHPTSCARPS